MDTQVLRMNTVNMLIRYSDVHALQRDLKRMKIRHMPFRRSCTHNGMWVELEDSAKITFIKLKYAY